MDTRKLQRAIVDGLEDVKAQDIVVFNTEHLSPLFERVVIASGTSNRQTKSLAASVRDQVKTQGGQILSMEGEDNGEWIIVDCGAAVVHIMQPGIRQYYHLEEIWGGKPVKLKLGSETRALPKASEGPAEEEPAKKPARKSVRKVEVEASTSPVEDKPAVKRTARKPAGTPQVAVAPVRKTRATTSTRKDPEAKEQAKVQAQRAAKAAAVAAGEQVAAKAARKTAAAAGTAAASKTAAGKATVGRKAPAKVAKTIVVQPEVRKTAPKAAAKKTAARKSIRS